MAKVKNINKTIYVSSDKSISHRAIIFGCIAEGKTVIKNCLLSLDCINTINCFKQLGCKIFINNSTVEIYGVGLYGLKKSATNLFVGNSGTTIRLLTGLLSGQNFSSVITGDNSILKRPMLRIKEPLELMGANITLNNDKAPIHIKKSKLNNIDYEMEVASAQVKSSIILASLYTNEITTIYEKIKSRNHTEIMLKNFGGNINIENNKISIQSSPLFGQTVYVPCDISSASFFIVLALITENSYIKLKNVLLNETRIGILKVLKKMNANISFQNIKYVNGEKIGDIICKYSKLIGTTIKNPIIPSLIDEIPIIAVASLFAKGKTIVKNATELKYKECDRIFAIVNEFKKIGAKITETSDGFIILGNQNYKGANLKSYDDHRIAMSLLILDKAIDGKIKIDNTNCINTSFKEFFSILNNIK